MTEPDKATAVEIADLIKYECGQEVLAGNDRVRYFAIQRALLWTECLFIRLQEMRDEIGDEVIGQALNKDFPPEALSG